MNLENILILSLCVSLYFIFDYKNRIKKVEAHMQRLHFDHRAKLADINTKIVSNIFENVAAEFKRRDLNEFKIKVNTLHEQEKIILSEIYPNGHCPAWDTNKFVKDFFSYDSFEGVQVGNINKKYIKITPEQLRGYPDGELDVLMSNLFFIITVKVRWEDLNMKYFFYNTYVLQNGF